MLQVLHARYVKGLNKCSTALSIDIKEASDSDIETHYRENKEFEKSESIKEIKRILVFALP
jgi:hypothetical protein